MTGAARPREARGRRVREGAPGGRRALAAAPALALVCTVLGALLLSGCDATLQHDLSEADANELVALLTSHGIDAAKAGDGRTGRFRVDVPRALVADAWTIARAADLPPASLPGVADWLDDAGVVPAPNTEAARQRAAIEGELARTLRLLDGVRDARVHLAHRSQVAGTLGRSEIVTSAAVLLRIEARAETGAVAPPDADVARLVAAAVDGLDAEAVSIVHTAAPRAAEPDASAPAAPHRAGYAGPASLRVALVVLSAFVIALAGLVLALLRRSRPSARSTPAAEVRL